VTSAIDTAAKRAKLQPRKNPYWRGVSGGRGGLSLGYRKPTNGAGTWIAKLVADRLRREIKLGPADDEPIEIGALTFKAATAAALEWGRQQHASMEVARASGNMKPPTVRTAVEEYIAAGKEGGRLKRYVLPDELASVQLTRLSEQKISEWRERLPVELATATKNRIVTDLRAALNAAAQKYRRQLPAYISAEIKVGTKAEFDPALPRHQLLTDEQIRNAVDVASDPEVDASGDFGRLLLLKAATGARFSQIARLKIRDVQVRNCRIMMSGSRKGRNRKTRPPVAIPVAPDVIERLKPAIANRKLDEFLLLRWSYCQKRGAVGWFKDKREPWKFAYEALEFWSLTIERAELPAGAIMYAFRHSSVVRMLLKNVPVRVVAAQHDTSIEMIEKHYAAFITDMSESLARTAVITITKVDQVLEAAE
jgi:integrase